MTVPRIIVAVALLFYARIVFVKCCFAEAGFERILGLQFSGQSRSSGIEIPLLRISSRLQSA